MVCSAVINLRKTAERGIPEKRQPFQAHFKKGEQIVINVIKLMAIFKLRGSTVPAPILDISIA
jgi:hypothetical protein